MLRFYKYRLPFKSGFQFACGSLSYREGIILQYEIDGIKAYGEAAPLPGFSEESLKQVITVLKTNKKQIEQALAGNAGREVLSVLDQIHHFPSLSFGLDTLLHDLDAKRQDKSISKFLHNPEPSPIPVNQVIPLASEEETVGLVKSGIKSGYKTFKIKVGNNFPAEKDLLKVLRNQFPEIRLRIDANQSWSTGEAIENLNSVAHLNIEYCEEPVNKNDTAGLKSVKENTSVPVAADESARTLEQAKKLIDDSAIDVLVLKPMLTGLIHNIFVTKQLADSHNIKLTLTTALESVIGRTMTAVLASGYGSGELAHGLATGFLLKEDIGDDQPVTNGAYHLPEHTGLGINVDLSNLEEISD